MADPFLQISAAVFQQTFDTLLRREDCTPTRRHVLETGKAAFLRSGGIAKQEAMHCLLSAYPATPPRPGEPQQQPLVVSIMAALMQGPKPLPQAAPGGIRPPGQVGAAGTSGADASDQGRAVAVVAPGGPANTYEDVTGDGPAEMDMLASAGVNLSEQEALLTRNARTRTIREVLPNTQEEHVLNQGPLNGVMQRLAKRNGIKSVDPACATYLTLAVEAHLTRLLVAMARVQGQRKDPARKYEGFMPLDTHRQLQGPGPMDTGGPHENGDPDSRGGNRQDPNNGISPQTHLVFRRHKPLLVRQGGDSTERFVAMARQLDPTTTLAAPAAAVAAAGAGPAQAGAAETLELPDLVAALERDTLMSKHPLVWRLHQKVTQSQPENAFV